MNKRTLIIIGASTVILIVLIILLFSAGKKPAPLQPTAPSNGTLPNTGNATYPAPNVLNSTSGATGGQQSSGTTAGNIPSSSNQLPTNTVSQIIQLSKEPAIGAVYDPSSGHIKYYLQKNGWVISSLPDGSNAVTISDTTISGIQQVVWSPSTTKVILFLQDGTKELYDYSTHQPTFLKNGVSAVGFSPDGGSVAFYDNTDPATPATDILNLSSMNQQQISSDIFLEPAFSWKGNNLFVRSVTPNLYRRPKNLDVYNTSTQKWSNIFNGVYGFSDAVSPNGNTILYSQTQVYGQNLDLFVHSATTGGERDLQLATIPEKCAFASNTLVYCAVPNSWPSFPQLPEDYTDGSIQTTDSFWAIDLTNGQKFEILKSSALSDKFDAEHLIVAGNYLIFTNKYNHLLYALKIH